MQLPPTVRALPDGRLYNVPEGTLVVECEYCGQVLAPVRGGWVCPTDLYSHEIEWLLLPELRPGQVAPVEHG